MHLIHWGTVRKRPRRVLPSEQAPRAEATTMAEGFPVNIPVSLLFSQFSQPSTLQPTASPFLPTEWSLGTPAAAELPVVGDLSWQILNRQPEISQHVLQICQDLAGRFPRTALLPPTTPPLPTELCPQCQRPYPAPGFPSGVAVSQLVVYAFGSTINGFADEASDVDISLLIEAGVPACTHRPHVIAWLRALQVCIVWDVNMAETLPMKVRLCATYFCLSCLIMDSSLLPVQFTGSHQLIATNINH